MIMKNRQEGHEEFFFIENRCAAADYVHRFVDTIVGFDFFKV